MAGETPKVWIGQEVSLHLWKSEDLGTEAHSAMLKARKGTILPSTLGVPYERSRSGRTRIVGSLRVLRSRDS
jgi:hypothetical protein